MDAPVALGDRRRLIGGLRPCAHVFAPVREWTGRRSSAPPGDQTGGRARPLTPASTSRFLGVVKAPVGLKNSPAVPREKVACGVRAYVPPKDAEVCATIYHEARQAAFTWVKASRFYGDDFTSDTAGESLLVAEENGCVVGFAGVYDRSFLHHLYVRPGWQGRGIGTALLKAVLEACEDRVRLKCLLKNRKALGFYERRGWRRGARGRDAFGAWVTLHSPGSLERDN